MNTNKLPRHADLDSQILAIDNPLGLALRLGCAATALITVIAWLGLFGLMFSGLIGWRLWPYVVAPIAGWVVLLGLPALKKTRKGALTILDALATTAEAWLARAGYSIDLNSDGYIGHIQPVQIEPPQTQTITPAIYNSAQGTRLLAHEAQAIPDVAEQPAEAEALTPTVAPLVRKLWNLPGNVKCPQETVETFVERIFIVGWGRGEWVGPGKPLERETYDALMNLLAQCGIIEGRKAGHAGKLVVEDSATAKRVLGLGASG